MDRNLLIGGIIGLVVGVIIGWAVASSKVSPIIPGSPPVQTQGAISPKQLNFRMDMRKLWEDHITWTRMYMISAIAEAEDKDNVAQRLLKNQEDPDNAIKPYYGNDAGDQLTSLLKTHITTAVTLIDAAKNNNQEALNKANTDWYNNANDIADYDKIHTQILSMADPLSTAIIKQFPDKF